MALQPSLRPRRVAWRSTYPNDGMALLGCSEQPQRTAASTHARSLTATLAHYAAGRLFMRDREPQGTYGADGAQKAAEASL